ncbi:hypothetical protein [Streptomyces xanthochromogenes]
MARATMWIDPKLTGAYVDGSGRIGLGDDDITRKNLAEFSHAHADYRLKNHQNEYDRVDAILALKRSMQSRIDHLDSIYGFKQYAEFRQLGPLGLLDHWGAIRRRMLHRMRQLRNAVEHDGAAPPNLDECEDYAEVTWWFLRGTSPLLMPITNIDYGGAFHGDIRYEYKPLRIRIWGDIEDELTSKHDRPGWLRINSELGGDEEKKGRGVSAGDLAGSRQIRAVISDSEWGHEFIRKAFRELL